MARTNSPDEVSPTLDLSIPGLLRTEHFHKAEISPGPVGNFRTGNNLRANWQGHVFARQSLNWHRDWDRGRDHWWNGHRCAFIGGSWVIFDFGFDPWWPYGYPYAYPYPPYPTGYYPDNYAPPADDYGYGQDQEETPSQRYYRENGK